MQDLAGVIGPWFDAYREARTALDAAGGAAGRGGESRATKAAPATWGKLAPAVSALPGRGAGGEGKWQYAIDDVRDQLSRLAGPKCLSTTPWTWLRHCPRYFPRSACASTPWPAAGWPRTASVRRIPSPLAGLSRLDRAARAAVRGRCGVDPVSLDAGGVSRLAFCPEAGNFDPRLAEAAGAAVVEGKRIKAEGGQSGPRLPPSISDA